LRNLTFCISFLAAASLAQADLVPYLCQEASSACGTTPAFTQLGVGSYVYNYSINLSAVEQINTTLGQSTVLLSGFTGVTSAMAPAGWTVGTVTPTSVTFNATSAVNGTGSTDFGIFAIDTSVGGGMTSTGSYASSAFKINGLPDSATGGLDVNAAAAMATPEPPAGLLIGLGLASIGLIGRARRPSR